jgi:hypothetical protein
MPFCFPLPVALRPERHDTYPSRRDAARIDFWSIADRILYTLHLLPSPSFSNLQARHLAALQLAGLPMALRSRAAVLLSAAPFCTMTFSLSVNFHNGPVLHISQHPTHNVNYNNNTSSGRMRRTEGRKEEKYIITERENLSQIKSGKAGNVKKREGHRMNDGECTVWVRAH